MRLLANNPGPFTGPGTNTWLLTDDGQSLVIDPGPIDREHMERIIASMTGRAPVGVLVTHTHPDHAPLANPLAKELGVPAFGHSPGPEFDPDIALQEGSEVAVGQSRLEVIHTPGHSDDHLCFRVGDALFSGDHIMGGSSVMVEDLAAYLSSLEKLHGTGLSRLHPGHGEEMDRPDQVIDWYLAHRRQRHQEILDAIGQGASSLDQIVAIVYRDVDASLHPLAAKSVQAHLELMFDRGEIASDRPGHVVLTAERP